MVTLEEVKAAAAVLSDEERSRIRLLHAGLDEVGDDVRGSRHHDDHSATRTAPDFHAPSAAPDRVPESVAVHPSPSSCRPPQGHRSKSAALHISSLGASTSRTAVST